jgi:protease-4
MYRIRTAPASPSSFALSNQHFAMRQFLKFMFASMLGTFLIGIVLIFLFIGSLAALGSSFAMEGKPTTVKDGSILHLQLDQEIVDRGNKDQFMLNFGPFRDANRIGLNSCWPRLDHAKTDDHIEGIFLDLTELQSRIRVMKEIREQADRLQEGERQTRRGLQRHLHPRHAITWPPLRMPSTCNPKATLQYHGLRSEYMFYKGLFEKLDIDVQFIRGSNNKFKSFGEVFTEDHMSEANREQNRAILNGLWDEHITAVSESRKLDKARLNLIADSLLVRNAESRAGPGHGGWPEVPRRGAGHPARTHGHTGR